nr:putative N-acetylmannosamine-6-phosphate 2-epimerase [Martelella alba]
MESAFRPDSLIVSCQPVPDGPMDDGIFVAAFAGAAEAAGAVALRVESAAYVRATRPAVKIPIIGIVKRDLDDSPVRITPFLSDVEDLVAAGADVIAFDATDRPRPVSVADLVKAAKAHGKMTMADCACLDDARRALALGVDFVGTTLSGYTGPGPEPVDPDLALISTMRALTPNVIAEGRIRTPDQAAAAIAAGARNVVVGSAITRTEHATTWFREAVEKAGSRRSSSVLALDIGGTKSMAALVTAGEVAETVTIATARADGPDAWLAAIAEKTAAWRGRYEYVGIAATGLIRQGMWQALNPKTLAIPGNYPLEERASTIFAAPARAFNDAQAAAWGEYLVSGRPGSSLVFLTISTGIGGGVVINGRLLTGLAGHFGLTGGMAPLEDRVSGRFIASEAERAGHAGDAISVFAAEARGEDWAEAIVAKTAQKVAALTADIQLMFDPDEIVIGGGIGLAPGFLARIKAEHQRLDERLKPRLAAARSGTAAGILGAADLALMDA